MKDLNKVYPLTTRLMWTWHFFTALVVTLMTLFFTMADKETALHIYLLTIAAGTVLASIPIYGFVRQVQMRHWVRKRCVGYGHGILYLADDVDYEDSLRAVVGTLCKSDLIGRVVSAFRQTSNARSKLFYKRPQEYVLAIAQPIVVQEDKIRGKKWKVMGLQLGRRVWLTWYGRNERTYRSLLGHELGHAVLVASGFQGSVAEHHMVIARAGLDHIFQVSRKRDRWSEPVGEV